jgi:hypothetical protein
VRVRQDESRLTPDEIRADFALRLKRRLEAMAASMSRGITRGEPESTGSAWRQQAYEHCGRIVELVLAECNGEEDSWSAGT